MNPNRKLNPDHLARIMELTSNSPYYQLLGIKLVELGHGYCRMEMQAEHRHMNPFGSVHGGAYASMIDCATYWAAYCDQDEDAGFTTMDISVTNLAMSKQGKLTIHAKTIKEGRSICMSEARIEDENGRLVSFGTGKLLMLNGRQSTADLVRAQGGEPLPPKFLD